MYTGGIEYDTLCGVHKSTEEQRYMRQWLENSKQNAEEKQVA